MSILDDPKVKRLIKIQDAVRAACPGEDVEVVDADQVYVNFDYLTAVCITPADTPDGVEIVVTEWDRSGGVNSELYLAGAVRQEYAPLIVKAFLEEQHRREAELQEHLENS